jgi:hypothetical protein
MRAAWTRKCHRDSAPAAGRIRTHIGLNVSAGYFYDSRVYVTTDGNKFDWSRSRPRWRFCWLSQHPPAPIIITEWVSPRDMDAWPNCMRACWTTGRFIYMFRATDVFTAGGELLRHSVHAPILVFARKIFALPPESLAVLIVCAQCYLCAPNRVEIYAPWITRAMKIEIDMLMAASLWQSYTRGILFDKYT